MQNNGYRVIMSIFGFVAFVLIAIGAYMALLYAPTEMTMGHAQRIFYFHVPSAWIAFLAFLIVFITSIGYLWKKEQKWDIWAKSSAEIGVIFCSLVLLSGPLWAKPVWGVWWTWDARLTTTLVLWLIYVSYLMIRAYGGENTQSIRFAAVVGIIGFLDIPIVSLSIVWWRTLHPRPVVMSGGLDPAMLKTLMVCLAGFTFLFLYLLIKRVSLEESEDRLEEVRKSLLV